MLFGEFAIGEYIILKEYNIPLIIRDIYLDTDIIKCSDFQGRTSFLAVSDVVKSI